MNELGVVCDELGRKREAYWYLSECLQRAVKFGHIRGESAASHNMGLFFLSTTEAERAWPLLERSAALDLETGASAQAAATLSVLAEEMRRRDPIRVRETAERALAIARGTGDQSLTVGALCSLASVLTEQGDTGAALRALDEAGALASGTGKRRRQGQVLFSKALALDHSGEYRSAFRHFEDAIALLEESYTELDTEAFRISFHSGFSVQNTYLTYSSRLVKYALSSGETGYADEAFRVCERRRARVLKEFLHKRFGGHARHAEEASAPVGETSRARLDVRLLRPPAVGEVRELLLDADTALLEYSLHNEVSYVWALTSDGQAVAPLTDGGVALRRRVGELREAVTKGSPDYRRLAHELYQVLIGPVRQRIAGKRNLLIVPDNALYLLPFQLLLTDPPGVSAPMRRGTTTSRAADPGPHDLGAGP